MIRFLIKTLKPELIKAHTKSVIFIWVLFIFVMPVGIMFWLFLFMGSFTIIDLHLNESAVLFMDAFLSIIFFLQHSLLIRPGIRSRLAKFIPDEYYNAFYGLTSGIFLLVVLMLWQKSSTLILSTDGFVHWIIRALFFLSFAGFYWGNRSLRSFDMLGVKRLMRYINNRPDSPQQISAKGPYRWVRHPLYLFMIVLIWSCPVLTSDRLLFNIIWTIWIVIGTYLEDRDLHHEFGSQYAAYSSRVPMLIPFRIPKN